MKGDRNKISDLARDRRETTDEAASDLVRDAYIVEKKVVPDVKKKSREEAEDRDFSFLYPRKVFQ